MFIRSSTCYFVHTCTYGISFNIRIVYGVHVHLHDYKRRNLIGEIFKVSRKGERVCTVRAITGVCIYNSNEIPRNWFCLCDDTYSTFCVMIHTPHQ